MAHPRIVRAFRAMKELGISEEKVKPVLKRLLKLFNKNWDPIEEENYRALLDGIFEFEEAEAAKREKSSKNVREDNLEKEEVVHEEPERPLKRLRLRGQDGQPSPSSLSGTPQTRHDVEGAELLGLPHSSNGQMDSESQPASSQCITGNKGKQPVSPNAMVQETFLLSQPSSALKIQPSATGYGLSSDKGKGVVSPQTVSAEKTLVSQKPYDALCEPSNPQSSNKKSHGHLALIKSKDEPGEARANGKVENAIDKSSILEIASSTNGDVKVILNCDTTIGKPNFEMPSLDAVVKLMENKCLRKYKDLDPKFSVIKVMQEVCQCFLELGAQSTTNNSSINGSEAARDE